MGDNQGLRYAVDLVMCIDGTGSMGHLIEQVKSNALNFYSLLEARMLEKSKKIDQLRARVIVFRDYWHDSAEEVMQCSEFFDLRSQTSNFSDFVKKIKADGGGDEPENGLEALAIALKSNWEKGDFSKQRYVVVIFTDASTHNLEKSDKPTHYPHDIPKSLDELTEYWEQMPTPAKRLLLFAPDAQPWSIIGQSWFNAIHYTSKAGDGLEEQDMDIILDAIANSV